MPRRERRAQIWIPTTWSGNWNVEIDGIDVTTIVISCEFSHGIIGFESIAKITLIDSDGTYAESYVGGESVELKLDGTSRWKGSLDRPKKKFGAAYTLEVIASHYQSELLDPHVTESYNGMMTKDEVIKDLIDNYLIGYTYTNVATTTETFTGNFDEKPFWDCIIDICGSTHDAYIDSDKDHHFFPKESIENTTQAIVWKDNLLEIIDFGTDQVDIKDKIKTYGEDDTGLPILYTTGTGTKEHIIKDTSIKTYEQAKAFGDAELSLQSIANDKGEIMSRILTTIAPGEKIWITQPIQKINDQFRIVKYTHFLPIGNTKTIIAKEKTIPQIFKDRKRSELQLQKITNPNKMKHSLNFTFDDLINIDTVLSDNNISVSEGNLLLSSGVSGTMISNLRNTNENLTSVHFKAVGDALAGTAYWVSTDNGDTYKQIELESLTSVTAGKQLRVKVILNNADTRLASLAVLYK